MHSTRSHKAPRQSAVKPAINRKKNARSFVTTSRVPKSTNQSLNIKKQQSAFAQAKRHAGVTSRPLEIQAEEVKVYTQKDVFTAAFDGDVVVMKDALAQAEPKLDVNVYDHYKQTPLILAIKHRNIKTVQLLHSLGADINMPCGDGVSPFYHTIRKNSVSLFTKFLALNPVTDHVLSGNQTPLTWAGKHGTQVAILDILRDMGFSIDHRDTWGRTPLMYAVKNARLREVEWWLNQGANPLLKDKTNKSALTYSWANHDRKVHTLVQKRAEEINRYRKQEDAIIKEQLSRMVPDTTTSPIANTPTAAATAAV